MSIRFKFRSAVNFDSVDIDGRSSISVGELRAKIIRQKNLNVCQDFRLVFSDDGSGREYDDDKFQIPSGSSVIIRRVPAETVPSAMTQINAGGNFGMRGPYPPKPVGNQMNEVDDFGADFCPFPEAIVPGSAMEFDKKYGDRENANVASLRLEHPKLESSDSSQDVAKGCDFGGNKGKIVEESRAEGQRKWEKILSSNPAALQNISLPSELKCPLCNAYFKEAVMIPCCQQSFCHKCIQLVLVEDVRCPKCLSDKFRVENLLPNLSLRQAIEHFLESQMLKNLSENALRKYAPDGESGIQANDVSCAVTVARRAPETPHSPSGTGQGSNQVMTESFYNSVLRRNASFRASAHHTNNLAADREMSTPVSMKGENELPQNHVHDEADSTNKKRRGFLVETGGGERKFMAAGRHNKVIRTCYICGSPDHLMRDCPIACGPHPMLQTGPGMLRGRIPGYLVSSWNGAVFPPLRPFPSVYANPGMMPFNASPVPLTPYGVPPYIRSMYGGLHPPGGLMRLRAMAPPVGDRAERPVGRSEFSELQHCENRKKPSNENLQRGQKCDGDKFDECHHYHEPETSSEHKDHKERETSGNHSEDSFKRRSGKNQLGRYTDSDTYSADGRHEKSSRYCNAGRDRKFYPLERSDPVREHMPDSNKHSEDRYKHHRRSSRKRHDEKEQSRSDSGRGHRGQSDRDDARWRCEPDIRGSHRKQNSYSESAHEPNSPADKRRRCKDKDSGCESNHPRHGRKRTSEGLSDDRWQMVSGSDEYRTGDHEHHKRKRYH